MSHRQIQYLLFTVQMPPGNATVSSAAEVMGIDSTDLDAGFGVAPIDPARGLYCVQVDAARLADIRKSDAIRGPFADVAIRPARDVDSLGT